MSKHQCSMAVAFVIAASWSKAADAQMYPAQPTNSGGLVRNLAIGVQLDIVDQRMAEKHLRLLAATREHHVAWGRSAAADRDARLMRNVRFRIAVDEWLIRKRLGQDPGCYPDLLCMDPITYAAIAQYHQPALFP